MNDWILQNRGKKVKQFFAPPPLTKNRNGGPYPDILFSIAL